MKTRSFPMLHYPARQVRPFQDVFSDTHKSAVGISIWSSVHQKDSSIPLSPVASALHSARLRTCIGVRLFRRSCQSPTSGQHKGCPYTGSRRRGSLYAARFMLPSMLLKTCLDLV